MKIRKGRFSGKIGNEVYVDSKYGPVVRGRPHRPGCRTPGRLRARGHFALVVARWQTRTHKQFVAWSVAALKANSQSPGGAGTLDAYHLFCKINLALAAACLPIVMYPPKPEKFRPNPVEELDIRKVRGVTRLRLRVLEAPAKYTFVLGSPPCSAGRSVRSNYSTICLLPPPVRGWCDITDMYVKRFGVLPAGKRVFIRTRQLINGWEDDFKHTDAVVPLG